MVGRFGGWVVGLLVGSVVGWLGVGWFGCWVFGLFCCWPVRWLGGLGGSGVGGCRFCGWLVRLLCLWLLCCFAFPKVSSKGYPEAITAYLATALEQAKSSVLKLQQQYGVEAVKCDAGMSCEQIEASLLAMDANTSEPLAAMNSFKTGVGKDIKNLCLA